MAEEGAKVVLADLADEQGQALAKALGGDYQRLDVTSEASWEAAVKAVDARHGLHAIFSTGRPEVGLTSSPACSNPLRR